MTGRSRSPTGAVRLGRSLVAVSLLVLISGTVGDNRWRTVGSVTALEQRALAITDRPSGQEGLSLGSRQSEAIGSAAQQESSEAFEPNEGSGAAILGADAQDLSTSPGGNDAVLSEVGGILGGTGDIESGAAWDLVLEPDRQTKDSSGDAHEAQDESADLLFDETFSSSSQLSPARGEDGAANHRGKKPMSPAGAVSATDRTSVVGADQDPEASASSASSAAAPTAVPEVSSQGSPDATGIPEGLAVMSSQAEPVAPKSAAVASTGLFSVTAPDLTGASTSPPASASTDATPADAGDPEPASPTPPWRPVSSPPATTGRPLRKSNRRSDPDIHTVLNNILSIIGGDHRRRADQQHACHL
ncbi:nuclear pore complex protein DDB_G0274915-like [Pollicipes pollicipes]|uniref:nuclear pore complex protein DDB_G0274915-like n=1 Tax=Pollicipes pollicipes TaxID=41117 RepID=UPI0018849474|nr:nuclear pore complex protein DDB_G0274915-like [Pollicipes pollicipes]